MQINNNNYSVLEILNMLERKELAVNRTYQRGSGIWPEAPSAYFIDTILEGFTFPKIYMYEYMDLAKQRIRKEIVDGQQRIGTIRRFFNNELALRTEGPNKGKKFQDLDEETQQAFLSYSVPVDVIRNAKRAEILQMFRRMNAYTLPLNEAEKRHSTFHGLFKWFVNELSDDLNEFFVEFGVFTERQITRMSDAALIADCILAMERGVISTNARDLNQLYKKYDDEFEEFELYHERVLETFNFIAGNFGELRKSFMMKPYALHSLFTSLVHCRFKIEPILDDWGVNPIGKFAADAKEASQKLLALSQAHEAKEIDGEYYRYVWGCLSTTDRKTRRTARVASILRVVGAEVPDVVDGDLPSQLKK